MALLLRPEPFSQEVNRLFNTLFDVGDAPAQRWLPPMDLVEAEDHYVLKADLPGLAEEDVSIEIQDNTLTVSGERNADHEQSERGWYRVERQFGALQPVAQPPGGDRRRGRERLVRQGRARGADPEARAAQAAPRADQRRRVEERSDRGDGQREVASGRHARGHLPDRRPRRVSPRGRPSSGSRRGADAGLRPARLDRHREGAPGHGGRGPRVRAGSRQHLPPVHPAGARADRRAGRAARVHGLAAADRHRLGRLPGVLDGPRLGGGGDQAPARGRRVADPLDRGGGGALPLLPGRLRALHGPGDLDGGAGRARLRHRARVRRVHAVPRRARLHPALDGADPPLARPLRGLACGARARGPGPVRDRAGRRVRGPAGGGGRAGGVAPSCPASPSAGRSARRRRRCARWWAGRCAACRTIAPATCSGSATWTTSCTRWGRGSTASTAPRPTRLARHGTALVPDPDARWRLDLKRPASRSSREPIEDGLPVPRLPRAHARLPALPGPRGRAHRGSAHHPAQPDLHGRA